MLPAIPVLSEQIFHSFVCIFSLQLTEKFAKEISTVQLTMTWGL